MSPDRPRDSAAPPDPLPEDLREYLRQAEYVVRDTARSHIATAKFLYSAKTWAEACFFAMTALEEIGKASLLQLSRANHDLSHLEDIRSHVPKAMVGCVSTLILNEEAQARHGMCPSSDISRIRVVSYLAEAPHEWMGLRNACLYTEVDAKARAIGAPQAAIRREHAYLMIVASLEALAQILHPYFTYHSRPESEDRAGHERVLSEIAEFMGAEAGHVDLNRLDFIGNPNRLMRLRNVVRAERERHYGPD